MTSGFLLNCRDSRGVETDWSFEDAADAQQVLSRTRDIPAGLADGSLREAPPKEVDLRRGWWPVRHQARTGACVGFAAADGVLRWHYVKKGLISEEERPSPRFIWMANKETDEITRYPTTFLEPAGSSTKSALRVAQKYGCVMEETLPMDGGLCSLRANVFFSIAARFRITAYYNLGLDFSDWRAWLSTVGPILTRLDVDDTWAGVGSDGVLSEYKKTRRYGGHAVCIVGYRPNCFIVRNSWGSDWGDEGFAYASTQYAKSAFTEAYGAV